MQSMDHHWAVPNSVNHTEEGPAIAAGICSQCATRIFPKPKICPKCLCTEIADVNIGGVGNLYSYSVVHAVREGWPSPYAIAYVDFASDIRICGPLDISGGRPLLDSPVRISVAQLRQDENGEPLHSHAFVPLGAEESVK